MTYLQATFEDKLELNSSFTKYSFELKNPHYLPFKAGQFVKIKISDNLEQEYFIFSSPDIDHGFEILIDQTVAGPSVDFFTNLSFGSVIDFSGPSGNFLINHDSDAELVLIGTGVGVSPLYSMVQELLQVKMSKRKITLFWGLDNLDQLFMTEDWQDLIESFPNFSFHPVMANALPEWSLCRGNVLDCLNVHEINADSDFYVCTDKETGEKIKNLCLTNGVKEDQLHIINYT